MNARVLVVDDEPDLCFLVNEHLKDSYSVSHFTEPAKAWAAQSESPFDIAVLDLFMPGMSGLDLLRLIRETEAETEVIILTGNASLDSAVEAIDLGIFSYLNKPVRFDQLRVVVDRAWQVIQLRESNRKLTQELAEANRKLSNEVETLARALADSEREAALGQGLAALAVRLQDPVARIIGMASLHDKVIEDLPKGCDSKALRGFGERIRETCERLHDHLEGLTVLSTHRSFDADLKPTSLIPTLQLSVEEARKNYPAALIHFTPPSESFRVPHLSTLVRRALAELFHNAVAVAGQEDIVVTLESAGSRVLVVVRDRGPGLSDDVKQGISKTDFYTSDSIKKAGIGLAVVRKVMADHGGKLRFTNIADGGAEFALVFPGCCK